MPCFANWCSFKKDHQPLYACSGKKALALKKKPSAEIAVARPQTDRVYVRDRMKSRRFDQLYDTLPDHVKTYFNDVDII